MSAGICGKRLGIEEIFGSPSSAPKRSRFSASSSSFSLDSDSSQDRDDKVFTLLRLFPSMDCKVIETILDSQHNNIDDAIRSLHALSLGDLSFRNNHAIVNKLPLDGCHKFPGTVNIQMSEQKGEDPFSKSFGLETTAATPFVDGSSWVDIFVKEMMKAANWDDVRGRATRILEAFEGNVVGKCRETLEQEIASLQEQFQSLTRENQILKRAVAIQHERGVEYEEKLKEAQQFKDMLSQYQEQIRTLELNNYTLKIHLQRAQGSSSIPGKFHPDVF